ncbi:hypothetical protein OUZ56_020622 [Daphnia magna]|uniref:Uncharacterized protein n=1 Tax=Daphnia magna TaxID=35525 RepID=A0ABQ9ZF02_9CRUS|nr:hypothetical protein OUZ56_020622 [Daphnia magna]
MPLTEKSVVLKRKNSIDGAMEILRSEEMPKLYKKTYKIGFDASVQVTAFTFSVILLHSKACKADSGWLL